MRSWSNLVPPFLVVIYTCVNVMRIHITPGYTSMILYNDYVEFLGHKHTINDSEEMSALDAYTNRVYRIIVLIIPIFCLCASATITILHHIGFSSHRLEPV